MNAATVTTQHPDGTFMALTDTPDLPRIRIALLALLPKDGTHVTVAKLAADAFISKANVTDALFDDYMDGRLGFDVCTDAFWSIRQDKQGARHG